MKASTFFLILTFILGGLTAFSVMQMFSADDLLIWAVLTIISTAFTGSSLVAYSIADFAEIFEDEQN